MAFTVTGRRAGIVYQVTWDAGQLSGDPEAVALVQECARELEGRLVGPVAGPYTETAHLRSALSTLFVMDRAFDEVLDATGQVPEAPDVPPGAVA